MTARASVSMKSHGSNDRAVDQAAGRANEELKASQTVTAPLLQQPF